MALDGHLAILADAGIEGLALAQLFHQHAGAAVDEPGHQLFVQGVADPVFQLAGQALPVGGIGHPVGAVGDVAERAHARQASGQAVDLAVDTVQRLVLAVDPVLGQALAAGGQVVEQGARHALVVVVGGLAEVRRLADVPQAEQGRAVGLAALDDVLVLGQGAQGALVQRLLRQRQAIALGRLVQRAQQSGQRTEVQPGVAPLGLGDRLEGVALDGLDQVLVDLLAVAGDAEGAVAGVAACATGDLADLLRIEPAGALAVELAQAREGHMVDVHVQAHADGVGGHQEVDLAGLVERDLGVAGAGAQAAHHDRRAAALAADQLGDRVDRVGGEGDDGAAAGQARQLLRACVGQVGEPLAPDDLGVRQQAAHQRGHGPCAQEHGLELAARMQQAVGEDVAALGIGAELDLVDGQELDLAGQRHGLDRADEIGRAGGDDLLLAGDQGHRGLAAQLDHPVVDLARQEAQRQADHARGVGQHALNGQMGLAGVGRPQNRGQLRRRQAGRTITHDPKVGRESSGGKPARRRDPLTSGGDGQALRASVAEGATFLGV